MTDNKKQSGYSKEEREAMKARSKELKAQQKADRKRADGEKEVMDAIAKMPEPDKSLAQQIHEIVSKTAPDLWPKTWYGFPAYAKDDKVVCFFQFASKFGSRYSTLGFNDTAKLDEGDMWPTVFAITNIGKEEEARIVELVKKAVS
jgi:uncharacterized protein YdhG (YjbR/CyaY superfamily)